METAMHVVMGILWILFWVVVFRYAVIPAFRYGTDNPDKVRRFMQFLKDARRK